MWKKISIFLLCTALVFGQDASSSDDSGVENGNLRILAKLLNDCSRKEDVTVCFKVKAVNFLGRLLRSPNAVPITESIALARDSSAPVDESNQTEQFSSEQDIEASLPRSLDKKNEKLDEIMWTMFKNLVSTRTIQFTSSDDASEARRRGGVGGGGGGGGGGKKNSGMMMMATMMVGMMMKMAMGKIALLAGKALIISKIALVLALVLALKKLSGGGGGESHPQVVYATAEHGGGGGGGSSGGWQRRYSSDAQQLAYGSHGEYNN